MDGSRSAATTLRRGLILLAILGVVGTATELAMQRHWKSAVQLIPWYTLGIIVVGVVLLVARPRAGTVQVVRVMMVVVFASAAFGVFEHVSANYDAGPLDRRYSDRWATMSTPARWWVAMTNGVGPSPPLAPAVLAQAALCLGLATLHHPALRSRRANVGPDGQVLELRQGEPGPDLRVVHALQEEGSGAPGGQGKARGAAQAPEGT